MSQHTTAPLQGGAEPVPRGGHLAVPCYLMRGGTSRGPFFRARDLPSDPAARDAVLLAAMGSPDPRQIDGLGGAHPLTSKAGVVDTSLRDDVDLEFLFAQIQPGSDVVDTTANCGNMLAAVVPFAVESGLLPPRGGTTTARVLTLNTGLIAEITVRTPREGSGHYVEYAGDTRIDGVPGTAAPVLIDFLDTAGSVCASLLPTGQVRDRVEVEGIGPLDVTCVDNGMPLVIVASSALGRTGHESVDALNADEELKSKLEALRLACGELMGLGDVRARNYPKMTLVSPPEHGGTINTRSFIPHVCHASIGVLAAVTAATAVVLEGTVAHDLAVLPGGPNEPPHRGQAAPTSESTSDTTGETTAGVTADTAVTVSVEHPAGEFSVELGLDPADRQHVTRSALLRTARLIMAGEVLVPSDLPRPTT
ncbi:4-oxalomesaconate tautomerase [Streptomyces tsukubensis]|uniref:PrpF protein n=1 Tax=Streptomyces tsukubensis TaxID=83656 RepID=A0A1V4AAX7_9ACTN|nr:4-oxalomesaconate tautomerase [Streptomyces tsukubensis]OON80105.1 PrpF protein [Streptomyces tsukubensis]QFR97335.1 4-oxalomesaconate tautomerase [Streptomyces tsukubensis]